MFNDDTKIYKGQFHSFYKTYEYYGSNLLKPEYSKAYRFADFMYDNYKDVYFEVLDDNSKLQEIVTHKEFIRIEHNDDLVYKYFNKETGLYLLVIKSDLEKRVDLKRMIRKVFDFNYVNRVEKFFQYYKNVNKKDDLLISSEQSLLLKKGIKFTED